MLTVNGFLKSVIPVFNDSAARGIHGHGHSMLVFGVGAYMPSFLSICQIFWWYYEPLKIQSLNSLLLFIEKRCSCVRLSASFKCQTTRIQPNFQMTDVSQTKVMSRWQFSVVWMRSPCRVTYSMIASGTLHDHADERCHHSPYIHLSVTDATN